MNLLTAENLSKSYGSCTLSGLNFGINEGQKIGLVAKNGSGKTSILRILAGIDDAEGGLVTKRKGLKLEFLAQEPDLDPKATIEETVLSAGHEILSVIQNYEKASQNAADEKNLQLAFEAMERVNGWDFETQYKQILSLLKLPALDEKVGNLSGGQKKRLALANALLSKPELLILDEPTNHLDLERIEWLEQYFQKEKITLFMVTHDRFFLDNVCNDY